MTTSGANWTIVSLGELAEFRNGLNFSKESYGSGLKVIGIPDFQDYVTPRYSELKEINPDGVATEEDLLHENDILFVRSNGNRDLIGRSLFIKDLKGRVSFSGFTIRLRFHSKGVCPRFYAHLFRSAIIRQLLSAHGGGTNINNLNQQILRQLKVPVPPLVEQKKIAAILSAYDDLIQNNERRIKILEDMAQNLYREWFVNFRFPGHTKVKMVDSPLGKIPQGWEVRPVNEFLSKTIGGGWGSEECSATDVCPVKVVRGTDFKDIRNGLFDRVPKRYITKRELQSRKLQDGDLIVENSVNASSRCVGTPFLITSGILKQLTEDAICASFCKLFRPVKPEYSHLLLLHMRHLRAEGKMGFYQNTAANGIGNFQSERFITDEMIPVPCDANQFDDFLLILGDLCTSSYSLRIRNLRQTRDLLLPKLISGEVDVSEVDITIPVNAA